MTHAPLLAKASWLGCVRSALLARLPAAAKLHQAVVAKLLLAAAHLPQLAVTLLQPAAKLLLAAAAKLLQAVVAKLILAVHLRSKVCSPSCVQSALLARLLAAAKLHLAVVAKLPPLPAVVKPHVVVAVHQLVNQVAVLSRLAVVVPQRANQAVESIQRVDVVQLLAADAKSLLAILADATLAAASHADVH